MLAQGFIPSKSAEDIANFLLTQEGLNKAAIGEYLGEAYVKSILVHFGVLTGMQ